MNLRHLPLLAALLAPPALHAAEPWVADLGDGRYQNPVLNADYSDPDAIRVGDTYYLVASSFNSAPGMPLLRSKDLVNWRLVGHALPALVPSDHFAVPRHGDGVWAPCLRYHDGKFWIFYPDPDYGVYVITAQEFSGPWSAPRLLLAGRGIIDPTPLWDDDGKAYLLHGWARSRAGINNRLTLRQMAPDATRLLDAEGATIVDGDRLPGYRTLEGPKFYKRNGWYYVFAPAGGVEEGWQAVFRSRAVGGPYEDRIVMEQGPSAVNGPHQGAWVQAQDGADWFLHFQDRGAYGRVLHLQPMRWVDDWPVIGAPGARAGVGNPVAGYRKPVAGQPVETPAAGDEFDGPALGLQWQWNANPQAGWQSLQARPGHLRLATVATPEARDFVRAAPNILAQKVPGAAFTADARIDWTPAADGERAGMILNGMRYAWLGLRRQDGRTEVVYATCAPAAVRCTERQTPLLALLPSVPATLWLRMTMRGDAQAQFLYSVDGVAYTPAGAPFAAAKGRWTGAQLGLFSVGDAAPAGPSGHLDVDYFRLTR